MIDDLEPTLPAGPDSPGPGEGEGTFGAYRLVALAARGGFGDVHRAEHPLLGPVALKILRRTDEMDEAMFDREGRLVLDHPGLPRILDRGIVEGRWYLTMEWIDGRTLQELLEEAPLAERRVSWIGQQVAEVLAHAHARGVVHRDLKPANVLVGEDDRAWVLDFGVARHATLGDPQEKGAIVGSPAFMAPEQALAQEVGPEADLYALGAVLYAAATGSVPIEAPTPAALVVALPHVPPLPIARRRPELSAGFAALVMGLLAKERGARPGPAARVARELAAIRRGAGGAGLVPEVARACAGAGGVLLVSGSARGEALAEIREAALAAGMTVRSATASPDDDAHGALVRAFGAAPAPRGPGRGPLLAAWTACLRAEAALRPLLLVVEEADAADDGSWEVVEALAPALPELPLLVVLAAGAVEGDLAGLAARLARTGVLARQARGEAAPAAPAPRGRARSAGEQLAAARQAGGSGAERLAMRRYREALAAGLGEGAERAARMELATLLVAAGRTEEAEPLLLEVQSASAAAGDARHRGRAVRQLGLLALAAHDLALAEERFAESERFATEAGDREEIAALDNNRGLLLRQMDRREEALRAFVEAGEVWEALGQQGRRAACVNNQAIVCQELGRMQESRALYASALALWTEEGDLGGQANVLTNQGGVLGELGDIAGARACYEEAVRLRRQVPDPRLLAMTLANLGAIMALSGEHEAALAVQNEALALGRRLQDHAIIGNCLDSASSALRGLGRDDEAERSQQDALEIRRTMGDRYGESMSLLALAMLRHDAGRCSEAVDLAERALALARALARPPLECQALIVLGRCRHDVAPPGEQGGIALLRHGLALADRLDSLDLGCQARLRLAESLAPSDAAAARVLVTDAADMARRGSHRQLQVEAMRLWERLRLP